MPRTSSSLRDRLEARSAVRRRLFQDSESSERDNEINIENELIQQSNEEAKRKWNFDFENEVPLEGDWEWEKVEERPPLECVRNENNQSKGQ